MSQPPPSGQRKKGKEVSVLRATGHGPISLQDRAASAQTKVKKRKVASKTSPYFTPEDKSDVDMVEADLPLPIKQQLLSMRRANSSSRALNNDGYDLAKLYEGLTRMSVDRVLGRCISRKIKGPEGQPPSPEPFPFVTTNGVGAVFTVLDHVSFVAYLQVFSLTFLQFAVLVFIGTISEFHVDDLDELLVTCCRQWKSSMQSLEGVGLDDSELFRVVYGHVCLLLSRFFDNAADAEEGGGGSDAWFHAGFGMCSTSAKDSGDAIGIAFWDSISNEDVDWEDFKAGGRTSVVRVGKQALDFDLFTKGPGGGTVP
jgi:hypothetical protein